MRSGQTVPRCGSEHVRGRPGAVGLFEAGRTLAARHLSEPMRRLLMLALAAVSACTPRVEPADASATASATAPAPAVSGDAPASADTSVVLALDPEGLRLVDAATGSTRPLPFGMPEADVVRVVSARTAQPAEASRNEECGAGPLAFSTWPNGLQLAFQDGRFAGWSLGERASPALTTMSGVGIGTLRADLDASVVTIV